MREYKVVPDPKNVQVSRGDTQSAVNLFSDIINYKVQSGWIYQSMSHWLSLRNPVVFNNPLQRIIIC